MFRAQQNAFEDAVGSSSCSDVEWEYKTDVLTVYIAKATDENLTSENWEFILVRIAYLCSAVMESNCSAGCLRQSQ